MLKQIRKKNEQTNQNLKNLLKKIDPSINESTLLPITHLTRIHDLVFSKFYHYIIFYIIVRSRP